MDDSAKEDLALLKGLDADVFTLVEHMSNLSNVSLVNTFRVLRAFFGTNLHDYAIGRYSIKFTPRFEAPKEGAYGE